MRADRLIRLTLLLQNEGKLTTAELSQRLEVSERTILRDMDALSASGIPVYAERGNRGGWKLSEGYRTRLTGLKANELVTLLLSTHSQLLSDLGMNDSFQDAQQKILAASPTMIHPTIQSIRSKIHIDGASWHPQEQNSSQLESIQEAVFSEQKLSIVYKRDDGSQPVERILCPLGLVAKRSVWYLVGMIDSSEHESHPQAELRTYRVSRIEAVIQLHEHFTPPVDFDLAAYWEQSKQQFRHTLPHYEAILRVEANLLSRIKQERFIRILQMQPCEQNWWELKLDLATLEYACQLLLGWGAEARIVHPPELKEQVIKAAHRLITAYEQDS